VFRKRTSSAETFVSMETQVSEKNDFCRAKIEMGQKSQVIFG